MSKHRYHILIDLAKIANPYCGLGQFAINFGNALVFLAATDETFRHNFQPFFLIPRQSQHLFSAAVSSPFLSSLRSFSSSLVEVEYTSWRRRYLPICCKTYDLWHAVHQDAAYFPSRRDAIYLLTIHDLNFLTEKSPAKAQRRLQRLQQKIDRAAAIVVVSEYTKSQVVEFCNIGSKPIYVIYNGVFFMSQDDQQSDGFFVNNIGDGLDLELIAMLGHDGRINAFQGNTKLGFCLDHATKPQDGEMNLNSVIELQGESEQRPFFFALSAILAKKNFHVLIDLMKLLPTYCLVIAGDKSDEYARVLERKISQCQLSDRIIMPGKISHATKQWLYEHCVAFLHPSLHEGFGLPVIEAMSFGKQVFLARSSSLPEIGGGEACYWDDFQPDEMKEVLLRGLKHYATDKNKKLRLLNHAQQFKWSETIRQYVKVYERLLLL